MSISVYTSFIFSVLWKFFPQKDYTIKQGDSIKTWKVVSVTCKKYMLRSRPNFMSSEYPLISSLALNSSKMHNFMSSSHI